MRKTAAPIVAAALVVGAMVLAPIVVVGWAAATVVAPANDAPSEQSVDAVIALAGEPERLRVADEIVDSTGGLLVVSWIPGAHPKRDDLCRDDPPSALCFHPFPVSTAGEARALGDLADDRGWERIVVVTSRYHVGRAQMLVGQCVDGAHLEVVSATDRLTREDVLEETLAVVAGLTLRRAC